MSTEEQVLKALAAENLTPVGKIVVSHEERPTIFVTIEVVRETSGTQFPSNVALHVASARLKEQGFNVEFLLRYENSEEMELGLRATILHSHIEHVRNVFLSLSANKARVWVEPKRALDVDIVHEIDDRARTFLSLFEVQFEKIILTSEELLPSKLALLNSIRKFAPASLTSITSDLVGKGFTVPSEDWLLRRLDALRKGADVVRLGTGEYTLTRHSLHNLGTIKGVRSPDITRLLALARRGS